MLTQKQTDESVQNTSTEYQYQEPDGNLILWEPAREPRRVSRKQKQVLKTSVKGE